MDPITVVAGFTAVIGLRLIGAYDLLGSLLVIGLAVTGNKGSIWGPLK